MAVNPALKQNVEKFRKHCYYLNGNFESLNVDDYSAFEVLSKYYNRTFDKKECEELINVIKTNLNKYSNNRDLQASLKEFAALCTILYAKTDSEFAEFKKAMGGKERKPIVVEDKKEEKKHEEKKEQKKTNQKTNERINYNNGDYYIGELLNGQFHGKGKYYWHDGDWHDGDWLNGVKHGEGISFVAQYKRTDTGTYKDGKRSGSGKMVWANGNWYEGGWNENGMHGKGTNYVKSQQRTDIGDFVDHERNGRGVMKWDSGERYEGTWKDTVNGLCGEGRYYRANGSSERGRYVNGDWKSNQSNDGTDIYIHNGNWLQNAGAWIWNNLIWLPWVATAVVAIIMLIDDGFNWTFVGVCIGGAIISAIMMVVIEIIKSILIWLWKIKWVVVAIGVLILARTIYVSNFKYSGFSQTPTVEQPTSYQPNYYCNASELNIRSTASANGTIIGKIKRGDEIYVYDENDTADFAKIRYNNEIAYVSNKYITKKE